MSDDLDYWRNNSWPIDFQNLAAGIIFTGSRISIDGFGTGGIDGNGDTWYTAEKGQTQKGRPMPFVFWNASEVNVTNFKVLQPPLWSILVKNTKDMRFDNILANATAHEAPPDTIWTGNTDGFGECHQKAPQSARMSNKEQTRSIRRTSS